MSHTALVSHRALLQASFSIPKVGHASSYEGDQREEKTKREGGFDRDLILTSCNRIPGAPV